MTKRNHAHSRRLCFAGEVCDWDAGESEDRIDVIELERIDDQMKAVGLLELGGNLEGGAGVARLLLRRVFTGRGRRFLRRRGGDFVHENLRP